MYWLSTAVHHIRSKRKCSSVSGSLCLPLLLPLVMYALMLCASTTATATAAVRASGGSDEDYDNFEIDADYGDADADNVEFHHVKIVNGVMHEDHPVIMYKEDFVSEDYVPNASNASSEQSAESSQLDGRRRSSSPTTEKYRTLKPEKIYFDLPHTPEVIGLDDGVSGESGKIDLANIRAELVPLVDDETSKHMLKKRPKKYRRRLRRDVYQAPDTKDAHVVHKRNPFYRIVAGGPNGVFGNQQFPVFPVPQFQRHAVPGKYWNGINGRIPDPVQQLPPPLATDEPFSVGPRRGCILGDDCRVWSRTKTVTKSPLFTTPRPFDLPPARVTSGPESIPPALAPADTTNRVSDCVWAIVSCCSSNDQKIRYSCFEQMGCRGAFWGINPCADRIRNSVVNQLAEDY